MADGKNPNPEDLESLMKELGIDQPTGAPAVSRETPQKSAAPAAGVQKPAFEQFAPSGKPDAASNIAMLRDVALNVKVELGRTKVLVQDVLKLGPGSIVELDKLTGDPLDLCVNDRLIARGEVLVINDNFAIRITEVVAPEREKTEK